MRKIHKKAAACVLGCLMMVLVIPVIGSLPGSKWNDL